MSEEKSFFWYSVFCLSVFCLFSDTIIKLCNNFSRNYITENLIQVVTCILFLFKKGNLIFLNFTLTKCKATTFINYSTNLEALHMRKVKFHLQTFGDVMVNTEQIFRDEIFNAQVNMVNEKVNMWKCICDVIDFL